MDWQAIAIYVLLTGMFVAVIGWPIVLSLALRPDDGHRQRDTQDRNNVPRPIPPETSR